MLPDRVSNPGPLTYESGALPIALRGPALTNLKNISNITPLLQEQVMAPTNPYGCIMHAHKHELMQAHTP